MNGSIPGPLHIYYSFHFSISVSPESVNESVSDSCDHSGHVSFYWFALFNLMSKIIFKFYYIFYDSVGLSLSSLFFPNKKQKGKRTRCEGDWVGAGRSRDGGNCSQDIFVK